MRWLALGAALLACGCYLFSDANRPCDANGNCLPGYTCVHGLCVVAGAKKLGDECQATGECQEGAVCADAYCSDPEGKSCERDADCGDTDTYTCIGGKCYCIKVCRKGCDFPDFSACSSGEICFSDREQGLGFCQEGQCGESPDGRNLGTCPQEQVCLEFNGPGSGLCWPMCDLLEQNIGCAQSPPQEGLLCCAAGDNCEHAALLWGAPKNPDYRFGLCFPGGQQDEGEPCSSSAENTNYCRRGLFCDAGGVCRRYCNLQGGAPSCAGGSVCTPLPNAPSQVPFGWCRPL